MTSTAPCAKIRLTHIITGLDVGGAETMLSKLVSNQNRERFELEVICLQPNGPIGERIAAMGIPVRSLEMRSAKGTLPAIGKLAGWLRRSRPDIVQTWMYHADLVGGIAARLSRRRAVAWNIRNGTLDSQGTKRSTLQVVRMLASLSRSLPSRIVCCSENARQLHAGMGYDADKMIVIPNGFDLDQFRPDPAARRDVRDELGVRADTPLVGLMARYHAQKDHGNFVEAAGILSKSMPDVQFLLCGLDVHSANSELMGYIAKSGAADRFHLLGKRSDMPRLTAALDVAVCASHFGEAFPNVLGEAMACGVPCATTDVGDAAYIVGDTGRVVPPKSPEELAGAIRALLTSASADRLQRSSAARQRVQEHFDLPLVALRYEKLYMEMAGGRN